MASSLDNREEDEAPQELSSHQGLQQHEELKNAQKQSKARVRQEVKERRKKWAERLTPRPKLKAKASEGDDEMVEDELEADISKESQVIRGMLPSDIVDILAAREKQVFSSDLEEETEKKPKAKKKKICPSGVEAVVLKKLPPAHCVQNSLDFLKKRKAQVPRSAAVLNNSSQALRLLSASGIL